MKKMILIGLLALLPILFMACSGAAGGVVAEESISIPLSEISTTARFYDLEVAGTKVKYFAVMGDDGEPRTAFDACDVCGGSAGYRQEGQDMVCNKCGRHFAISEIGTKNKGGGCWPSYLSHEIVGDNIVIKKSEIAAGSWRFG